MKGKMKKTYLLLAMLTIFSMLLFTNLALPATECTYSISPSSSTLPSGPGIGGVDITTQSGCPWIASSKVNWITLSPSSGTGNGSISYTVSANVGTRQRTGTMTIAKKTFRVTQEGSAASTIVFPLPTTLPDACLDETYSFQVPVPSGGNGGPYHFELGTGGFPPLGIILNLDGSLSGSPAVSGSKGTFLICAVDTGGNSNCKKTSIKVSDSPCCSTLKDVCNEISNYGSCPTVYSCTTPSGGGYYKTGGEYFCCVGTNAEENCEQTNDSLEQFCNAPPLCTSFTYSDWSPAICPPNGEQTRTVTSSSPPDCVGGSPVLSQRCIYVPPSHVCSGTASCNAYGAAQCTVQYPCDQGTCTYRVSAGAPSQFSINIDANGNVTGGIDGKLDVNGNFTWTWTGEGFLVSGHGTMTCSGDSLSGTGSWTVNGSVATASCSGGGTFSCNGTASN